MIQKGEVGEVGGREVRYGPHRMLATPRSVQRAIDDAGDDYDSDICDDAFMSELFVVISLKRQRVSRSSCVMV